jgi:hypothetical protein
VHSLPWVRELTVGPRAVLGRRCVEESGSLCGLREDDIMSGVKLEDPGTQSFGLIAASLAWGRDAFRFFESNLFRYQAVASSFSALDSRSESKLRKAGRLSSL